MTNESGFADHSLSKPKRKRWLNPDTIEERLAQRRAEAEREFYEEISWDSAGGKVCYFIGTREAGGIVKIGHTKNLYDHFSRLNSNAALYTLKIFASCWGGRGAEAHYHRKFKEHALGGEWFDWCPEIEAEIAKLNEIARLNGRPVGDCNA